MATQMVESGNLKGVEIRGIGDTVAMLAALKSKQVDASMATISMMEAAEREGWGVPLVSINEPEVWRRTIGLGGDVQGQWIYGLEDYIRSNPAIVQAFVTGWVRGHDFVMSNKTETVVDLIYSDFLSPFKRDTVAQAVSVLKEKVWSADNMITADAYRRVVSIMSGDKLVSDAEAARFPYDGAVDMSFVRKARNR
jgi:NitT/TauT family transport system substrate-binding protein